MICGKYILDSANEIGGFEDQCMISVVRQDVNGVLQKSHNLVPLSRHRANR